MYSGLRESASSFSRRCRTWTSIVRGSRKSARAPQRLEQHAAAVDPAGVRDERAKQLELDVGELHRFPAHFDRPARDVDHEAVQLDQLWLVLAVDPPVLAWSAGRARSSARTRERNSRIEKGFVM